MLKVRFLKDFGSFKKDTYRVILNEDSENYYIQVNLHTLETLKFPKSKNGVLFQVIERS